MKLITRIKLGLQIIFGFKFGVIVDNAYAKDGTIADYKISGADVGVLMIRD